MGESGSPCQSPSLCKKGTPGEPLRSTRDEEDAKEMAIKSLHRCPKPIHCSKSSKKSPMNRIKRLRNVEFHENQRPFLPKGILDCVLHEEKVILNAPPFNEGTLTGGDDAL